MAAATLGFDALSEATRAQIDQSSQAFEAGDVADEKQARAAFWKAQCDAHAGLQAAYEGVLLAYTYDFDTLHTATGVPSPLFDCAFTEKKAYEAKQWQHASVDNFKANRGDLRKLEARWAVAAAKGEATDGDLKARITEFLGAINLDNYREVVSDDAATA
jgi:hypothetical protein